MRKTQRNRGFTLIEVMATLVIFMVAVTGLAALQRVSTDGADRAKQLTGAVNVASYFLTQLRTEFSAWKDGDEFIPANFPDNQFPMLSVSLANVGEWLTVNNDEFRVDQYLGHSELDDDAEAISKFCVNYKISRAEFDPDETDNSDVMVWTARVRVSWPKGGRFQEGGGWKNCQKTEVENRIDVDNSDEAVELVSIISREFSL